MSIECKEIGRLLYPYQDGSLASPGREQVADHISVCDNCRLEFLLIQRIDEAISAEPLIEPGRDFTKAVMAKIPVKQRDPLLNWQKILPWVAGYLAAASLLSMVIYWTVITLWQRQVSIIETAIAEKTPGVSGRVIGWFDERLLALVRDVVSLIGAINFHQLEMPFAVLTSFLIIFIIQRATEVVSSRLELRR